MDANPNALYYFIYFFGRVVHKNREKKNKITMSFKDIYTDRPSKKERKKKTNAEYKNIT